MPEQSRFENVDLFASLEAIMKQNTGFYQSDLEIDKELLFLGWTVIHFWGKEILSDTDECVRVVEETIFDIMTAD